ncbi:MAG: ankyrin repeat domain-containing protein, partial [Proteobacteria bacterium]|nr:ankyrin repeat domain-containing protein [Pseudomonadota bacterium]
MNKTNMTSWEVIISELYQLYMACKKREHQEVSKLIQQLKLKERLNVEFKLVVGDKSTTLHLMCFYGNLGMVKLLVEMYGNAEAKDENQRTPLHLACMQGHLDIAQYLFERGCNLQCEDKDGWKPIELAGFHNQTDIIKYFYVQLSKADLLKLFQGIDQLYQLFTGYKKRNFHLITESNSHL